MRDTAVSSDAAAKYSDSRDGDFLHKNAETPLRECYVAGGATCSFETNCKQLLEAARESFRQLAIPPETIDFSVRIWVDDSISVRPPQLRPYVRGLDHLVFAGFDAENSMLANLRTRHVVGRFSASVGTDVANWKNLVFPILLSILAGSLGLVELHASCVAKGVGGLLLIGPSRSGKSTLAMAFSEAGYRLLSDDRTFCSYKHGRLLASALPRPLKLRREAAAWFEKFRGLGPTHVQNGEPVFHWQSSPSEPSSRDCEPRLLVFLERQEAPSFLLNSIAPSDARNRIEQDLLAETPDAMQEQAETIDRLLTLPCRRLTYGGTPQMIVERLERQLEI